MSPTAGPPSAFAIFVALLLLTGLMRLGEVIVSARRIRARRDRVVAEDGLFAAMAALHAALIVGPIVEVLALDRPCVPWLAMTAASALGLATLLRVWTLRTIGRAWNVRVVVPPADAIATTGPYAFIRHPNYLAVVIEIAALPLIHTAWLSCVGLSTVNAVVLYHRIRTEETQLMALPAWREAMRDRARFVPGLF